MLKSPQFNACSQQSHPLFGNYFFHVHEMDTDRRKIGYPMTELSDLAPNGSCVALSRSCILMAASKLGTSVERGYAQPQN